MQIPAQYKAQNIEKKWYQYWMENGFFSSKPNEKEPFTMVIPPPNVTGVLHVGHLLNNTIQDVLVRRARLLGKNACWVPGTDHASIATEAKVVAFLKEKGIDKKSISREEFMEYAWEWTHKYGGIILEQLKLLGCSCDWDRTKFTLDEDMSESVKNVFIDLYKEGLIYRDNRMVNWDPEAQTTLSDEEVEYVDKEGHLFYIKYAIENTDEYLTIATTRPETIFGDTAICVHPEDNRFKDLIGKSALVPICNRAIPIIADTYIDMEFGTGCLKVTPAHDENDFKLGEKHQLQSIDIFNDDGTLNKNGLHYEGEDRFKVRKSITKELQHIEALLKKESYNNRVGISERTKAIIEPKLSKQWFLKMEEMAKIGLDAVLKSQEVKLWPKKFENTYKHWLENIRDWNVSRQLFWGHRIPVFYYGTHSEEYVVANSEEEALSLAKQKSGNLQLKASGLQQDPDVLDTWFSAWLWPMSVFDGIRNPENEDFKYYYPTQDLVTGHDILFFWIARMIMAGKKFTDKAPFSNVYFTGLVRDKQRRKMSKQLGNSPDAIKIIESYGADGVRVGLLLSSSAGNDLMFDESLCQQGKAFCNKIWNAFRLIKGWEVSEGKQPKSTSMAIDWYKEKFQQTYEEVEKAYENYKISDALMAIYKLVWDDFCSWLLEVVKPEYQKPIDSKSYAQIIELFENNLKLLHPFTPFISEEIWHHIQTRNNKEALIVNRFPIKSPYQETAIIEFEMVKEIVSGIRTIRKEHQISFREKINLYTQESSEVISKWESVISKMGNISEMEAKNEQGDNWVSFRVQKLECFIPVEKKIEAGAEIEKLKEEKKYIEGFLNSVQKKLSNSKFVSNAPEKVVELEKKKESDALVKLKVINQSLQKLEATSY